LVGLLAAGLVQAPALLSPDTREFKEHSQIRKWRALREHLPGEIPHPNRLMLKVFFLMLKPLLKTVMSWGGGRVANAALNSTMISKRK
jgi:hypothetical protein